MKKTLLSAASSIGIVTAALLFTGCGDSDSSSSSSSTAGTQTGQFVKGAWKGIGYTRNNGVSNISGTTGDNGTFTYNLGDNVTFDFGLGTAKWVSGSTTGNSTAPAAVAVTACENPSTGGTWTVTDAAKVAAVFGAFGVNETDMGTTNLATFMSSVRAKVGADYNISLVPPASLDVVVRMMTTGITGAPATVNTTYASAEHTHKVAEVTAALVAATTPVGYNLNVTNKKIVLGNGTVVVPVGTLGSDNNTFTNGTHTYTILGKLTGGTGLLVEEGGVNVSAVAKVVAYDLSTIGGGLIGKNISVSVDGVNNTYTFNGTGTTGTYTLNRSGTASVGNWTVTTDDLGIQLVPTDSTGAPNGTNTTVTFEDDFTASNGVVAKIWSGVIGSITLAYADLVEVVYSTATTVLKHLHY